MTFGHEDIRARLVEYLYEELEGPARAAFDAHLAGCATCRAETEAAGRARGVARAVVRASVGDPLPLGLRARVLEAAATAARERTARAGVAAALGVAHAVPTSAAPPPAVGEGGIPVRGREAPVHQARQGWRGWRPWMDRLRGRWTLPTFATVGALAAFLLVRGTIFREARRPLGETPAERLGAPAVAPGAARAPTAPFDQPRDRDVAATPEGGPEAPLPRPEEKPHQGPQGAVRGGRDGLLDPVARSVRGGQGQAMDRRQAIGSLEGLGSGAPAKAPSQPARRDSSGAPRASASNRAAGAAARKDGANGDDLLDGLRGKSSNERRPAPASAPDPAAGSAGRRRAASSGAALDVEATGDSYPSGGATAEAETELRKGTAPLSRDESARFAQPPPAPPPPPRVAPAPTPPVRPAPAPASPTGPASSKPSPPASAHPLPGAPAPEPPRPAAASAESAATAAVREEQPSGREMKAKKRTADKSEAAAEQVNPRAAAPAAARSVDPAIALSDRAAKLLASRRFTEASAAYRDLLRRFPDHPSAPLWRARLAASDHAAASDSTGFTAPPPPR